MNPSKAAVVGTADISAWLIAPGTIWIQTRKPATAKRLSRRGDARRVAYSVAGGFLRTYEIRRPLSWAKHLIERLTQNEKVTNGPFLMSAAPLTHRTVGGARLEPSPE